ncbi:hypothetical protein QWY82_18210 [Simiduia curdlanivorans]|uniref:Cardiolipin synthase N-terminal domain-containing protein n=1 Tax=Simiduia curdlanivorans TaxID=1492769 RepID=A0ABV8V574_9GAMM|nr:hypothetical protein [Simiduia curdlanivorans]MDN3640738.1 hypothetical protein [Simiduia curdlanivorans]
MPLFIIIMLLQVLLIVHAMKTGRNTLWIWVLLMAPMIGGLAYLIVELLPAWSSSNSAQKARKKVRDITDPHRDFRLAQDNLKRNETIQNLVNMAKECAGKGLYKDAEMFYERALKGIYQTDPILLEGLAGVQLLDQRYEDCKRTLNSLIQHNPNFRSKTGHVMYAQCLYHLKDIDGASEEFEALKKYHATALVKYHLGEIRHRQNRPTDALNEFRSIIEQENAWDPSGNGDEQWLTKAQARIAEITKTVH